MNKNKSTSSHRKARSLAVLLMSIFLYPVLSTFWHHEYPIVSPEFLYAVLLIILLSVALAAVLAQTRSLVINLFLALLILLALMVQFNLLLEGLLVAMVVLTVFMLLARKYFMPLMTAVFLAMIVGSYFDTLMDRWSNNAISDSETVDASLPPVIHIILDQFIGLDGLPPETPAQLFRTTMLEFFEENGFQVYTQAYSNYVNTEDSLNQAFNFQDSVGDAPRLSFLLLKNYSFENNAYFDAIREKGYAIQVYQSDGIKFCNSTRPPPEKCWTYNIPDLVSVYYGYENPIDRLKIILRIMISQSWLLNQVAEERGLPRPGGFSYFKPAVFEELSKDITASYQGRMFFAHMLFPHSPFVYLSDCSLNYQVDEQWRFSNYSGTQPNTPETRGNRYILYLEQARCALNLLDEFFNVLRGHGIYDQSVIVLHGDHGSTIYELHPVIGNQELLTTNDLLDAFSTLYAVKMPGGQFEVHNEPISLAHLIQQLAVEITDHEAVELESEPFIYLKGEAERIRVDTNIFGPRPSNAAGGEELVD